MFSDPFSAERVGDRHGVLPSSPKLHAPNCGIVSTRWKSRRPIHAKRLYDALEEISSGTVRGRGYLWLANRPGFIQLWESAGEYLALETSGMWLPECDDGAWQAVSAERRTSASLLWDPYYGERRNELVFTGNDFEMLTLHELLNRCLLTDAEISAGADSWCLPDDPFADALGSADPPPSWGHHPQ